MGKITGFMEYKRVDESYDAVKERVKHYKEFTIPLKRKRIKKPRRTMHGLWHPILSQWVSIR